MSGAAVLQAAVIASLNAVEELGGTYDLAPLQAVPPYATVEIGPESDWGHKSGGGREVRLAIVVRDEGERPERLRRIMSEAEAAVLGLGAGLEGWRVVSLALARTMASRERSGRWAGLVEFRVRMLAQ